MGRLFHLGTFAGIPIKIHWTFGLMVFLVLYISMQHGLSGAATLGFSLLVLVAFLCVILHEYGHALSARRYGISTHDIIISPIGGLARLSDIPSNPLQELIIAFAGPAVNLVIAICCGLYLKFAMDTNLLPPTEDFELLAYSGEFLKFVFLMNVGLFIFNLIPAFPMDGGRVLRALLATMMDRVVATRIAMWIGRILSVAFLAVSYYSGNITWALIGAFVFIMAGKEYQQVLFNSKANTKVREIMRKTFSKFQSSDSYETLITAYRQGAEKNFLIYQNSEPHGAVPREFVEDAIKSETIPAQISDRMTTTFAVVSPEATIKDVANMMNENGIAICAIKEDDDIVAVLDREEISRFFK